MVLSAFNGAHGQGELYFLPRLPMAKVDCISFPDYLQVLKHHLLPSWGIHQSAHFMQDGTPAHRTKLVKQWLREEHIPISE